MTAASAAHVSYLQLDRTDSLQTCKALFEDMLNVAKMHQCARVIVYTRMIIHNLLVSRDY